jgi:ribosomal protein L34E
MAAPSGPSNAPAPASSRCARCGAAFHCGIDDAGGCWCARLPSLPRQAYAAGTGCLCEACLRKALKGESG